VEVAGWAEGVEGGVVHCVWWYGGGVGRCCVCGYGVRVRVFERLCEFEGIERCCCVVVVCMDCSRGCRCCESSLVGSRGAVAQWLLLSSCSCASSTEMENVAMR
jgi:hypothetical protein